MLLISNKNYLREIYIILIAIFYVLWGTSWEINTFSISTTTIFYLLIFLVPFIFINDGKKFSKQFIICYIWYIVFICIFSIIGFSNATNIVDQNYILNYTSKLLIVPFIIHSIPTLIKSTENLKSFLYYFGITFILIYSYLHYLYIFVFKQPYVGVIIESSYSMVGKNSFGASVAFILPFIFVYLYSKSSNKSIIFLTLIFLIISVYFIESRSMAIVIIVELFVLLIITTSKKIKKHLLFFSLIGSMLIPLVFFENFKSFFYKGLYNSAENQTIIDARNKNYGYNQDYILFNTHRGWLLHESFIGAKNNYFIGSGIGTFRARDTNRGSKTETHNDWTLILYETGALGVSTLLIFFYYRFHSFYFSSKKIIRNDLYLQASIASLAGLMTMMLFTNFISTGIFWFIIALNIGIHRNILNSKNYSINS